MHHSRFRLELVLLIVALVTAEGCQTLKEVAGLRKLDFGIAGVTAPRLAGVDISNIRSPEEVSAADMVRLGSALVRKEVNLDVTLLVSAENPADNPVDARVLRLDWVLLLDDRETISGITDSDVLISPGSTADIPVLLSVNLVDFFDTGIRDLLDLALAVSGVGGAPKRVKLKATPTVSTVLGPMRFPEPITIISKNVGG